MTYPYTPRRSFRFPWDGFWRAVGITVGVLVLVLSLISYTNAYRTEVRQEGCVVTGLNMFAYDPVTKQTVKRVVTENCGTFNIAMDAGRGQYLPQMNEMYDSLTVGEAYTFTSAGINNPVLANYPNIIKIEQ